MDDEQPPPPSDALPQASELGTGSPRSSSYGMMNSSSREGNFQGFLQAQLPIDSANASSSTSTAHSVQPQQITASGRNPNDILTTSGAAAAAKVIDTTKKCTDTVASLVPANNTRPQNSAVMSPCKGSLVSNSFEQGSQGPSKGAVHNFPMVQEEARVPLGIPSLRAVQARSTISGSEQSDDDESEGEGEAETTPHGDPGDVKRLRRMRCNRESARRSRIRKQAHLTELHTQVSQLKMKTTSLEDRLTGVRCKYNEAVIDNRVLKADVETLRVKVMMAERRVRRLTGLDPLYQATSDMSRVSMQSFVGSRAAPSIDACATLLMGNDSSHNFYQSPSNALTQPLDHPSPEQLGRQPANR